MKIATRILVVLILVLCHFQSSYLQVWTNVILYLVIAVLFGLTTIDIWKSNADFKITVPEILIGVFIVYLIANNALKGTLLGNERFLNYLICFSIYIPLKYLNKRDNKLIEYVFCGILLGLSIELTVGFGQLFGLVPSSNSRFVLSGLFGNPGAFGGYLAIVFPILLASVIIYKDRFKSENLLYAVILGLCCTLCLLILSDSRGAWLGTFVGTLFVFNHKFRIVEYATIILKSKASKRIASITLTISIIFICFALYQYKPESAFGRLFIWKTSKSMTLDNPMTGNGFGFFKSNYGKTQAQYFLNNIASKNEIQVADYVTLAYNEFLEMLIESGIIGLILFLSIIYFALLKRRNQNNAKYHLAAKASLISLLVLSMVSYPFRFMPNLLTMAVCLFVLLNSNNFRKYTIPKYKKTFISVALLCVLGILLLCFRQNYGKYHFRTGYSKVLSSDIDNGITSYKKALPILQNNGEFLFYIGSAYYQKQNFPECIRYLKRATALSSEPNSFITLGNALKEEKRYKEAEQAYLTASGITPSKLYPKYLLAKLYIEMKETDKALDMATFITDTNEKVPTTAGTQIKDEMHNYITQITKTLNMEL
ncbi:O-antigen ligase family protein [Halosquirtibacter laminarini]|uniref:O-antigen ligase family protein n=1 Tax=Halosquirtibacter laminarini TaxID=3374600 RepID=A0AC61NNR0_9BACT|nr:O-antigen ligase family protein [Prolixibacteraceae bacterium]